MEIRVRIDGVEETEARLSRIQGTAWLVPPMRQSVLTPQRRLATYPPPPPDSRYRRSGTLGRRWTTKVEWQGETVIGHVGNNTECAPWVQARNFQAWMHRGRWQTEADVLEQETHTITDYFRAALQRVSG